MQNENYSPALEYVQRGLALTTAGQYEQAVQAFLTAQEKDAEYLESYIQLSNTYAAMEQYPLARAELEKVLLVDKNNAGAYFLLGNVYIMEGEPDKGIEAYNKAVFLGYEEAQLYYNLALLYDELGNPSMALRNYTKAISADPLRPDFRLRKASLYIAMQSYEEAIQTLRELVEACPDLFDGYHMLFEVYCVLQRFEEAGAVLEGARELFPKDVSLFYDAIRLETVRGNLDKALAMCDEAEAMPGSEEEKRNLYFERAKIYGQNNRPEQALEWFEKTVALEEGETDMEARYFTMSVGLALGKFQLALENAEVLERVFDHETVPEYQFEFGLPARYIKSVCQRELGDEGAAEATLREAARYYRSVSIDFPQLLDVYIMRAVCHKDLGENNTALELLDYVLTLQPESAEALGLKAEVLRAEGNEEEAEKALKAAGRINPAYQGT